jgi:hypothetical protein
LRQAGLLSRWKRKPSRKGSGFEQPLEPHQHWHVDVSYINLSGTFYYLCSVLDGCSRFLLHWDLRESMKEADIERILERAKEKYPEAKPRIISDNGPQFIARDFKEFIRISGMTHVRAPRRFTRSRTGKSNVGISCSNGRVHSAPDAVDPGRCAPPDSNLRGSLQHSATAQCHREENIREQMKIRRLTVQDHFGRCEHGRVTFFHNERTWCPGSTVRITTETKVQIWLNWEFWQFPSDSKMDRLGRFCCGGLDPSEERRTSPRLTECRKPGKGRKVAAFSQIPQLVACWFCQSHSLSHME